MKNKKIIVLLVILLFFISVSCFAEPLEKAFEDKVGYKYDKFTKEWSYFQAWSHEYKDAYVVIGLQVDGDSDDQLPPELYCWIRDENNSKTINVVDKIYVLVGDDIYKFNEVYKGKSSSSVLLGKESKGFLEALSKADSITVRLYHENGHVDEEIESYDFSTSLKRGAQVILDSKIWDYVNPFYESLASTYAPVKD